MKKIFFYNQKRNNEKEKTRENPNLYLNIKKEQLSEWKNKWNLWSIIMKDKKTNEKESRSDGFKWRNVEGLRIIDSVVSIRKQKQFSLKIKEKSPKK